MPYNRHIDKTEEELCKLKEVYSRNDVDRFTDGLESGRINSEEKVLSFTNYIRTSDGLTQLEYTRLKRLMEEGFIEKFATNYNTRYGTCNMLMSKMRSSISRGMTMLEKLCNKKRSRGNDNSKRKVIDNSKIGNSPYNSALWGLDYYKESVHTLYNEIVNYERHLTECIDLCLYIIQEVDYIRNHPETAHEKYQNSRQRVLLNNRSVIRRFVDMNAEMENDLMEKVEAWKQEKKSMEEICASLYHTLDENEYNDWVISEEVMAARRQGITNQERALWGDDKQQVMRCRTAYSHLDELNPEGQKGHIGGKFLAMLHKWSRVQPSRGLEYWHTYFTDFYRSNGGQMAPVKIGAIKRGQSMITRDIIEQKELDDFNHTMDALVEKHMETPTDEEKT